MEQRQERHWKGGVMYTALFTLRTVRIFDKNRNVLRAWYRYEPTNLPLRAYVPLYGVRTGVVHFRYYRIYNTHAFWSLKLGLLSQLKCVRRIHCSLVPA